MKFQTGIIFLVLLVFCACKAQNIQAEINQEISNINSNWQYLEDNALSISDLNAKTWKNIDLPHTWNQWDAVDMLPGYRRDASWYKKDIYIDAQPNHLLYFEGVNISCEIYVNQKLAGTHVGGYVGFEIDISPFVIKNRKNTIHIRVDNSYNPNIIPSQKADFFIYGGIPRDVWLKSLPEYYIKNIAVSTPKVNANKAETTVKLDFNTIKFKDKTISIQTEIIDPITNKVIQTKNLNIDELSSENSFSFSTINHPKLWSPEHPNLYTIKTSLVQNNKIIHTIYTKIGYRWYKFQPHGAFFLNGERLLLRGTHRHEEHAGLGAALPNDLHRNDIKMIKDMGANFIRLAHYPQDPEIYKTCDELGLIVWDELPWCRGGMGGKEWENNTIRLLKEQIHQNLNHPSIFFWSLGNEIYWLPDFENGDNVERMNGFVKKLNSIAHQMDPSRLTAIRKYYAGADLVDVFSPSIWSGWYAGVYTNYEKALTESQKKYPKLLHMEYGGASHLGRHTENPIDGNGTVNSDDWAEAANQINVKNVAKAGDWSENYIVDLFDWHLGISEQKSDFPGNAQWAFKDFGTPLRPENAIPYLNQKGIVDRAGKPKDAYYVFKSYWSKIPFTYIESHTWTERSGPKGKARQICVFSNCEQVQLMHNGKKLDKKNRVLGQFPACGLHWDIQFSNGENTLISNGFKNGQIITSDTIKVKYFYKKAEKADHIQLTNKVLENGNHLIEAIMMDKNGRRVLDYEKTVYFSKDGQGTLLKNYGTPTRSQIIQMANGYAAIELIPAKNGKAIIECRNQDFKGSYLIIEFGTSRL